MQRAHDMLFRRSLSLIHSLHTISTLLTLNALLAVIHRIIQLLYADEFTTASFLPDVSQAAFTQSFLHLEGLHEALEHLLIVQVNSVILIGAKNWHKVVFRASQAIRITL